MRFLRLFLLLQILAAEASAHPDLQNTMWILFQPTGARVAVNVTLKEILVTGGIAEREDGAYDLAALERAAEAHGEYLLAHLHFRAGQTELAGRLLGVTPPPILGGVENSFYQYELEYPAASGAPTIQLGHDLLREFPYAPGQAWNLSYVVRVKYAGSDEVTGWQLRAAEPLTLSTGWPAAPTAASPPPAQGGGPSWIAVAVVGGAATLALGLVLLRRLRAR